METFKHLHCGVSYVPKINTVDSALGPNAHYVVNCLGLFLMWRRNVSVHKKPIISQKVWKKIALIVHPDFPPPPPLGTQIIHPTESKPCDLLAAVPAYVSRQLSLAWRRIHTKKKRLPPA